MELEKNSYLRFWLAGLLFAFLQSFGNPALAVDIYEPDDTYGQATTITTDGVVQTHDFDPAGDNDWVKFSAVDGDSYIIETSNLGENCDTYIYLYDTNGTTVLDWDDDSGNEPFASRIVWVASGPGTYYVMARHWDNSTGGVNANYDIAITTFIPGSISGTVTTAGGTPIPNIYIYISVSNWDLAVGDQTDINGNYSIGGLAARNYYVSTYDWSGVYAGEWYDDVIKRVSATPVVVTEGEETPDINFVLAIGGMISGVVTADADGSPIPGLGVTVMNDTLETLRNTTTQGDGSYIITGLNNDIYWVQVDTWGTDYIAESYDDAVVPGQATPVIVTEGEETPDINFGLAIGGVISGIVTADADGSPISGVKVYAYDYNTGYYEGSASTQADGSYTIKGLYNGRYRVKVKTGGTDYIAESYDDAVSSGQATPVIVTKGEETPDIDFGLAIGGMISGIVTADADDSPISGVSVYAYDYNTESYVDSVSTQADGSYTIGCLYTGNYRVEVKTSGTDYLAESYDDISNSNSATPVVVTEGNETPDINFGLAIGGMILGIVTADADDSPISGLWVYADDFNTGKRIGSVYTQGDGSYTIGRFYTGTYRLRVNNMYTNYIAEYYDDVVSYESATPVSVTQGVKTTNIDFGLATGGMISGVVTADSDGNPIPGFLLLAIDYNSDEIVEIVSADIDGVYVINGLPTGEYLVWALSGYNGRKDASEFYNDILNYQDATPVSVTAGTNTPDINFSLAAGGSISGEISYPGFTTGNIYIGVFSTSSYTPFRPTTQSDIFLGSPLGPYTLVGIASGEWYVAALMDLNHNYIYDSGEPFGEYICNPVSVTAGSDTPNIDIELDSEGGICEGEEEAGCSCVTISPSSSESLETEYMVGFLLPFLVVFLIIVVLIKKSKKHIVIKKIKA